MRHLRYRVLILGSIPLLLAGCISYGKEFPTPTAETIKIGVTTRAELLQLFGPPTQVGLEDGDQTWTWIHVRAGGFVQKRSKELHVKFNGRGLVKSYSYTSDVPEELQQKMK